MLMTDYELSGILEMCICAYVQLDIDYNPKNPHQY